MVVGVLAALCPAPVAAAVVPLPIAAVLTGDGRTSLVVDLGASTGPGRRTAVVTHDGTPMAAELLPVMSGGLAVTLVVDSSTAGARALPAWLSAAARFVLDAPPRTETAVITAGTPAAVLAGPRAGQTGIVRALDGVRAGGDRDTAAALDLAARQFPAAPAGRRVIVLYTTAPDAGGTPAADLGARLRAAGTILVVVGAGAGRYWPVAAAGTGGFFAPAGDPVVVPALDQVRATLRGRHLVRFATPRPLPARVAVRVTTPELELAGEATIPAPGASPGPAGWGPAGWAVTGTAALITLVAAGLVLRGNRDPGPPRGEPPVAGPRPPARGRARVPGTPSRGRAPVPPS